MTKAQSLLLLFLTFAAGALVLTPKVSGQRDDRVKPSGAIYICHIDPSRPECCAVNPTHPACQSTATPTPTPRVLRKGLVLGAGGVVRPSNPPNDQDVRFAPAPGTSQESNLSILNSSQTGYVRLWVDWRVLQPSRGTDIRADAATKPIVEGLDAQIKEARRNGLKIILTVNHSYPTWAVWRWGARCRGEAARTEVSKRVPAELGPNSPWAQFIRFLVRDYGRSKNKEVEGDADFNRYVDFLEVVNEPNLTHRTCLRNERGRLTIARDVAEMFVTAQRIVREESATLVGGGALDEGQVTLKLAGPATSDTLRGGAKVIDPKDANHKYVSYKLFTKELIEALEAEGFAGDEHFAWSHHNYLDMEEQRDCSPGDAACQRRAAQLCPAYERERRRENLLSRINSASWVEDILTRGHRGYVWGGMRHEGAPAVMLTEGGVRLDKVMEIYGCRIGLRRPPQPDLCRCLNNPALPYPCNRATDDDFRDEDGDLCVVDDNPDFIAYAAEVEAKMAEVKGEQARLVEKSWGLMTQGPLSAGVALFTNYLGYTDPVYDTGLFDYIASCDETDWGKRADPTGRGTYKKICTGAGGGPRPLYDTWKTLGVQQQ